MRFNLVFFSNNNIRKINDENENDILTIKERKNKKGE